MSSQAISLSDVSKWFPQRRRDRLRMGLPFGASTTPPPYAVMALDRIELQIPKGQSVGVIGNNGVGKSTLLRLIAGISEPSRGSVRVDGKVASMIELGIGFHPEFTGAENLRHAAALLGMRRRRLAAMWNDIVEFSGVEHALDQPVRGYSSGMLARLGYSLVVHTDAEIILFDEVLAVGDLDFQVRGFERLVQLHEEGRTTVLVTHAVSVLPELCDRILRLDGGRLVADGKPPEIVPEYVSEEERKLDERQHLPLELHDIELEPSVLEPLGSLTVRGVVEAQEPIDSLRVVLRIAFGVARLAAGFPGEAPPIVNMPLKLDLHNGPGRWQVDVTVSSLPLSPGQFQAGLAIVDKTGTVLRRVLLPISVIGDPNVEEPLRLALQESHAKLS